MGELRTNVRQYPKYPGMPSRQRAAAAAASFLIASLVLAPAGVQARPARAAAAVSQATASVVSVSLTPGSESTRLRVHCSGPVTMIWGRLRQPERVFVDVTGAVLGEAPKQLTSPGSMVRRVRARQLSSRTVRFEADLDRRREVKIIASGSKRLVALDFMAEDGSEVPETRPQPVTTLKQIVRRATPGRPSSGGPVRVTGIQFSTGTPAVELLIRGSSRLQASSQTLPGASPRFYVDIKDADLAASLPPVAPAHAGLIRAVRAAQLSTDTSVCRVVLDLVPGTSAAMVPSGDGETVKVVVRKGTAGDQTASAEKGTPVSLRSHSPTLAKRGAAGARGQVMIALDPGHGGLDSGAINSKLGLQEKVVTLDVSHRVRQLLEKAGYRVVMSRAVDERLKPTQRIGWLQTLRADMLVSIHCDSIDGKEDLDGVTTYFRGGSEAGRELAAGIQDALVEASGAPDRGVRPDTTRYDAGFYLLRNARQPAVLVETGYISNPETARKFNSPDYRQQLARGIVAGIEAYLKGQPVREARR